MPVFTTSLKKIDERDAKQSVRAIANHLRYMQEQLEYTLNNLDTGNFANDSTMVEHIVINGAGGASSSEFKGNYFSLKGANGEVFEAGMNGGTFCFTLKGANGSEMMRLSNGQLVITNNAALSVDGGEW